jgi:hypothetical protein
LEAGAGKDLEMDPQEGKIGKKWKKDTILTERSYRSSENTGLSFFRGQKRTGF